MYVVIIARFIALCSHIIYELSSLGVYENTTVEIMKFMVLPGVCGTRVYIFVLLTTEVHPPMRKKLDH